MEDTKQNSLQSQKIEQATLYSQIENLKKINNLEDLKLRINELNQSKDLSTIQKFIIMFFSYYNHLTSRTDANSKLIQLSTFMMNNFTKKDIISLIQKEIVQNFNEDIKNYKILSDKSRNYDDYEICFSICFLSRKKEIIEIFFHNFLNMKIFDTNEYNNINLDNPVTLILLDTIFNKVYEQIKNNKRENLSAIIKKCIEDSNSSFNNLFHCPKCYDIMRIKLNNNNNFELKCINCDKNYKEYGELEILKSIYNQFFCINCKTKIMLYQENLKCTTCKNILCWDCQNEHLKNCFSFNYIKLYQVGFICEIHNKDFIEYCFLCKKNICQYCKDIHYHRTKEVSNIDTKIKNFADNYSLFSSITAEKNNSIKFYLSYIYLELKKRKLFNGYIYEALCKLFKIDRKKEEEIELLFKKFNNDDFKSYYSKIFTKIEQGNIFYLNCLISIQEHYKRKNINIFVPDYKIINERENSLQIFIENSKSFLSQLGFLHKFINNDIRFNQMKKENKKLKINITEIQYELLSYKNSNKILEGNSHNILCRFLSDELLTTIVLKYYNKLDNIPFKLNIFIDLISEDNYDILSSEDVLNSISETSKEFNGMVQEFKINPNNNELKTKIINFVRSSSNQIKFISDIFLENGEVISKDYLNEIIEILFFIKKIGNKTAHPNINAKESLKMFNSPNLLFNFDIKTYFEDKINNIMKEKIEYDNINFKNFKLEDYNIERNLEKYRNELKKDMLQKITEIRDKMLLNFNENKLKERVSIEDMIKVILYGNDEIVLNQSKDFIKLLVEDTNNIMENYLNFNYETKLSNEITNINDFVNLLKRIKIFLGDFEELKIIKHKNFEGYINHKVKDYKNIYSSYILFIEELKFIKMPENDCTLKEIKAEVCFLFLKKILENEIQLLKSIKENYEKEIIQYIIYKEIFKKMNEILAKFQERFNDDNTPKLTTLIEKKLSEGNSNLTLKKIEIILNKILSKDVNIVLTKNERLNIDSKLFYLQHTNFHHL